MFFPKNPFRTPSARPLKKLFSWARPFKIYFFLKKGLQNFTFQFFFLEDGLRFFFLESVSQFFFPGECLSKLIFFLESASQNFPGEGPQIFFSLDFLCPTPRSLIVIPLHQLSRSSFVTLRKEKGAP